jgi:hypothetical protein
MDNQKETIYRRIKEKSPENHKRETGQLRNTIKQKGKRVN